MCSRPSICGQCRSCTRNGGKWCTGCHGKVFYSTKLCLFIHVLKPTYLFINFDPEVTILKSVGCLSVNVLLNKPNRTLAFSFDAMFGFSKVKQVTYIQLKSDLFHVLFNR